MKRKIIGITFFLIIQTIVATAYPDNEKNVRWYGSKSSTLEQWDYFELNHNGNSYKIEVIDFIRREDLIAGISPYVFVRLYKNNIILLQVAILNKGEPVIYKEVKLEVLDIIKTTSIWRRDPYNPWAVIQISFRDVADFDVILENEYEISPWGDISVPIKIKNIGNADAQNVKLVIDPGSLILKDYQIIIGPLKKGETREYILNFKVPKSLLEDPSQEPYYHIDITVRSKDVEKAIARNIRIKPHFSDSDVIISKYVSPNNIDICENATVEMILKNKGLYNIKNISIFDEIPYYFEQKDTTSPYWTVPLLKPTEEKKLSYDVKINENIHNQEYIPSAKASFTFGGNLYTVISNNPKIYVQYVPIKSTDSIDVNLYSPKLNISRGEETVIFLSATIKRPYPYFMLVLTPPSNFHITSRDGGQSTVGETILKKQFNLLKQLEPEDKTNVINLNIKSVDIGSFMIKGKALLYYPRGKSEEVKVCLPITVNP